MTITVNEKEYPLQWGMGALEIYCDLMECDLDGLGMIDDQAHPLQMQKALVALIYSAIKNGCDVNDTDCDVTMAKLRVAIDEMPQEQFTAYMDDFANSRYLGKSVRDHLYGSLTPATTQKKTKASK